MISEKEIIDILNDDRNYDNYTAKEIDGEIIIDGRILNDKNNLCLYSIG